jgi:enamine deaminase RidA (YjgF/YER057c/UK114 family)
MSDQNSTESIQFINPPELESPPGYSHVVDVRGSRLIFLAGQTARNVHGELVGGSNLETQAEQAFKNISVALTSVGCTPANLVKLTVYVRDMSKLSDYRRARDRFLNSVQPAAAPAITLVEVSRLFAEGLLIEIEGIAAL